MHKNKKANICTRKHEDTQFLVSNDIILKFSFITRKFAVI